MSQNDFKTKEELKYNKLTPITKLFILNPLQIGQLKQYFSELEGDH